MSLTERQLLSLDIDKNIAVTAGAGSGKTKVLVERYLEVLRRDSKMMPGNILALTFTDKAASQMRDRIRSSVKEMLPGDPVRWSKVLEELESADISTIHSFCTKLVRNDPIPCGLDPDLKVITETESKEFLGESINELLTVDGPVSKSLRRLLVDMGTRMTSSMLISMVEERSRTHIDISSEEFRRRSIEHLHDSWKVRFERAKDELLPIIDHLKGLSGIEVPDVLRDTAVPLMKEMQPVFDAAAVGEGPERILQLLDGARDHLFRQGRKERGIGRLGNSKVWGPDHGRIKECFSLLFPFAYRNRDVIALARSQDIMERAQERVSDLLSVYAELERKWSDKKRKANGMDFDDQISLSLMLLKGGSPDLLSSLRRRYGHLLVDEFQDTDPRQWELVELLWDGGKRSKLFIVGDPKQSIYGFRSADVRLFFEAQRGLDAHDEGRTIVLDRNFRSKSEIMGFVNSLFPKIMEEEGSRWEVGFDPLDPHRDQGGSVSVIGVLGSKGSEIREGARAAGLIKTAVRGWSISDDDGERPLSFGDIAILLPTRRGFMHYEDALRSENIPYQVYKGKGFFERQEVKDVLCLLRFLSDPTDDLSLASLLKGPFFGLSDEDLLSITGCGKGILLERISSHPSFAEEVELLGHMVNISRSMTPYIGMPRILETLGAHALGGGLRGSRNLDRILEWVMEERSAATIHQLKERLARLVDDPPNEGEPPLVTGEDSVTIMTIHAAKGLEWPMVFVLGMNHEPKGGWTRNFNIDPERGISIKVMDTSRGELVKTPSFLDLEEDQEDKELQERKRLLYVACTRARDHLVLSGSIPVDGSGREREPRGMMRLLCNSLDLSVEELDLQLKMMDNVPVTLIKVTQDEISGEHSDDDEEAGSVEVDMVEGSIEVPGHAEAGGKSFLLSPSRLLRTKEERRGFPMNYPDPHKGISPDVLGDMVHAVLQGIPVERVTVEKGCMGSEEIVMQQVRSIERKLDKEDLVPLYSEVEVVGKSRGELLLGRIDLLARDRDGRLHIVDHKTGRKKKVHLDQVGIYRDMLEPLAGEEVSTDIISSGED